MTASSPVPHLAAVKIELAGKVEHEGASRINVSVPGGLFQGILSSKG